MQKISINNARTRDEIPLAELEDRLAMVLEWKASLSDSDERQGDLSTVAYVLRIEILLKKLGNNYLC